MVGDKTEIEGVELEERIINLEKFKETLSFYKIPLIFGLIGAFLLGGALILWQSNKESAKITFIQETEQDSVKIKIDIEGAVVNPGVYELVSSARVQDLLIAAGGLSAVADREWLNKNLNLAAKLVDGGKIYIPQIGEVKSGRGEGGQGGGIIAGANLQTTVNINNATLDELDRLPGIGPVTAQKIIENRPYQTTEEILSRKIVGKSTFEKIKDKISSY